MQSARGPEATWDGPGITTTAPLVVRRFRDGDRRRHAAQQVTQIGPTDTDTWAGQTITGASVLAMYTYVGDANLDGTVTGDDYAGIDFNVGTGADGWFNGDFNFDGAVTGDDYAPIDFAVGQTPQLPMGGGAEVDRRRSRALRLRLSGVRRRTARAPSSTAS